MDQVKNRYIDIIDAFTWASILFIIGSIDISTAITLGEINYDTTTNAISPSLWLLVMGILIVFSSTLEPIYKITKSTHIILLPSAIMLSGISIFGLAGIEILYNIINDDNYIMYCYLFIITYFISVIMLTSFLLELRIEFDSK